MTRRYPHLHRIAWGGRPEVSEREEFSFGVERILDGVQALMDNNSRDDNNRRDMDNDRR